MASKLRHIAIAVADTDYDNLFIVVPSEKPRLIQLHYR